MSKESEARDTSLRANAIETSATVKKRIEYITQKTSQFCSIIAMRLKDRVIDALKENEHLMNAICDAFDNFDKAGDDVKRRKKAHTHLLHIESLYRRAQQHYIEVENDLTDYVASQGDVLVIQGLNSF
jgi:hypothetical protein